MSLLLPLLILLSSLSLVVVGAVLIGDRRGRGQTRIEKTRKEIKREREEKEDEGGRDVEEKGDEEK